MSEQVVAKRYADALFELGGEKNTLDVYMNDLKVVQEVFNSDEELEQFFTHPSVNNETKIQILTKSFTKLHIDILNTLKMLVERDRINLIQTIVDQFVQLVNDKLGIAEAKVYSVRELSTSEQEQLKLTFAKRFNKSEIQIINIVDPKILGGIKVQIGNTIFDGSVTSKLRRIERSIITANN